MATEDPYYSRKPVPDSFIRDIGETGLTPEEEFLARERKYSSKSGKDIRKFWNPSSKKKGGVDPYYQRAQVPDSLIKDVGVTGLSPAEEHLNRERKYSLADGSDIRRFSTSKKGTGFNDAYYSRKKLSDAEIVGVGETGNTPAEDYGTRERKQSMFQLSDDPFAIATGKGHRQSVSGPGLTEVAVAAHRRKSSAIAPDAAHAASNGHGHSGYDGPSLAPIESRPEFPGNSEGTLGGSDLAESSSNGTRAQQTVHEIHEYDDPDSVAPHEKR